MRDSSRMSHIFSRDNVVRMSRHARILVKFENFMHSEWREEKYLKGSVGKKVGYSSETSTTR